MSSSPRIPWNAPDAQWRTGEFFRNLSSAAIREFEFLAAPFYRPRNTVLFTHEQVPSSILLLLEGSVKLSLNSNTGGRLIIGIAQPGELLGLTAVVSGLPYAMTAETQFPCIVTSLPRQSFLSFLIRYPVACLNVAREVSLDHRHACEQLHRLALTSSAPRRLARLMVAWCADAESDGSDTRFHCSLTHEEIGEHIGASRETVTRALSELKSHGLLEQHGAILVVPNRTVLARFAGGG
jgi:CRP/FNR family transcriptional regulator, cyclic AMP receptor protein